MKAEVKADSQSRLAKIAGQVSGLQKMVSNERGCSEILQQIVAVRAALDQLGVVFLSEHLQTCVLHQDVKDEAECCTQVSESNRSAEIKTSLRRFLK